MADGASNEAEAAAFANKVQAMLIEHNISMGDLEVEETPEISTEDMNANRTGKAWRRKLAYAVGRYYMCEMWYDNDRGNRGRFMVTGKPHNRAVAISMYGYLIKTVKRLATAHARQVGQDFITNQREYAELSKGMKITGFDIGPAPKLKQVRNDFDKGCCMGLATRLHDMADAMIETPTSSDAKGQQLALYKNERELAKDFAWEENGLKDMRQGNMTSGGDHAKAGREASKDIGLSDQIESAPSGTLLN